jgi:hypothetical protein
MGRICSQEVEETMAIQVWILYFRPIHSEMADRTITALYDLVVL